MKKVLLCDDSKLILELLDLKLKNFDCTIVGKAKNGQEGVDMYKSLRPDVVFLDITMPIKDGKSCLSEIKSFDPLATILMLSAISDEATISVCMDMGAKGFVKKQSLSSPTAFDGIVCNFIQQKKIAG